MCVHQWSSAELLLHTTARRTNSARAVSNIAPTPPCISHRLWIFIVVDCLRSKQVFQTFNSKPLSLPFFLLLQVQSLEWETFLWSSRRWGARVWLRRKVASFVISLSQSPMNRKAFQFCEKLCCPSGWQIIHFISSHLVQDRPILPPLNGHSATAAGPYSPETFHLLPVETCFFAAFRPRHLSTAARWEIKDIPTFVFDLLGREFTQQIQWCQITGNGKSYAPLNCEET